MKKNDSIVGIIAIICVFSIPILGVIRPILRDLIPFVYIAGSIGLFTLASRSLLKYGHELRIEEMREQTKLKQLENEGFAQAEKLIKLRTGESVTKEEKKMFEDELLELAKEKDSGLKVAESSKSDKKEI
jgi:hypothetical protein